jgi:integral membrane protein (TIGR01906 family)
MLKTVDNILSVLSTLLVPFLLILGAVRILLTPVFVEVEYRLPHFPPDEYGFSFQERLKYAQRSRRYLLNDQGVDYLGDLTFPDGEDLFNERELRHMEDVKDVLQVFLKIFWGSVVLFILVMIWFGRRGMWPVAWRALSRGGWLTVVLLVSTLFFALIDFNRFFIVFHRLFFEGRSWIFKYSDTLIRLFPIRFWQDVFIAFGIMSLGGGVLLGWGLRSKGQGGKENNPEEVSSGLF